MTAEQGQGTGSGRMPALNIERIYNTTIPADELARAPRRPSAPQGPHGQTRAHQWPSADCGRAIVTRTRRATADRSSTSAVSSTVVFRCRSGAVDTVAVPGRTPCLSVHIRLVAMDHRTAHAAGPHPAGRHRSDGTALSHRLGYPDVSYFIKRFRADHGMTPAQWRHAAPSA